jgi:hypothetical protein
MKRCWSGDLVLFYHLSLVSFKLWCSVIGIDLSLKGTTPPPPPPPQKKKKNEKTWFPYLRIFYFYFILKKLSSYFIF